MRSARVTVLMKPEEKKALEAKAKRRGVSSGEYLRLAVDNFERVSDDEEAALAALVEEVNKAIPKMTASLDHMSRTLRKTSKEVDQTLRAAGIRE